MVYVIGLVLLVSAMVLGVITGYMDGPDFMKTDIHDKGPQIVSLVTVLLLVSAGLVARRPSVLHMLRGFLMWGALGLLLVVLYAFRHDLAMVKDRVLAEVMPGSIIENSNGEITVTKGLSGQFVVEASVDNAPVTFLIDTGASHLTLKEEDARRAGFNTGSLNYSTPVSTANGLGYVAPIRLEEVRLGPVVLTNVRGFVAQPGMLNTSLFGMSTLGKFAGWRVEGDRMILTPRPGMNQSRL
ncbi:TIGR02281 family clan AA aspartic protease [Rhodobacteraceae bacterium RKSG542]|uniref:retropepsin-like aspartic protease family protein n=1 Tax=Pseudovibrio flavus TaxID=2529854 RepID=UPI0012BCC2E9|nr:TIGR02281 family clan AA aspartic protease [Pseudovibrio flavus]MTI16990.1 TIGR02281 family clan AA aspartic protease [Pseudovibrio flavus]